jgi:hypothetical protein
LSHIHALLWLVPNSETLDVTLNQIRGSTLDFIHPSEVSSHIDEGLLRNMQHCSEVIDKAREVLLHKCSERCKRRTGPQENHLLCRVTNNGIKSPRPREHCIRELYVQHSVACCEVLEKLKLVQLDNVSGMYIPTDDSLKATKHYIHLQFQMKGIFHLVMDGCS